MKEVVQLTTENLPGTGTSLAQPNAAGELLIVRSTDGAESITLNIHGTYSTVYESDAVAVVMEREIQTTQSFMTLIHEFITGTAFGTVTTHGQGTAGSAQIIFTAQPNDGEFYYLGLTGGYGVSYLFVTTLSGGGNEVLIGAAIADTMNNWEACVTLAAGAGTLYGVGSSVNPVVIAEATGNTLNVTDKLACLRRLAWDIQTNVTGASNPGQLFGGVNGELLSSFTAGTTFAVSGDVILDNEDLSNANLLAGLAFVGEWIYIGGKRATLYYNVAGAAITPSYETRTEDGGAAFAGNTTLPASSGGTAQVISCGEASIEWLRFRITNPDTVARNVHAVVIHG
jgi:hypothetical protein